MEVFLREFSTEERKKLADEGKAMSDGSYPIVTVEDLKNAIQAFGRTDNPGATKAHIMKRARALGATSLLPEEWKSSKMEALAYGGIDELPSAVKDNYTARCQQVFLRVFNKTLSSGDSEERAFQNGHAAAKNCTSGTE